MPAAPAVLPSCDSHQFLAFNAFKSALFPPSRKPRTGQWGKKRRRSEWGTEWVRGRACVCGGKVAIVHIKARLCPFLFLLSSFLLSAVMGVGATLPAAAVRSGHRRRHCSTQSLGLFGDSASSIYQETGRQNFKNKINYTKLCPA